MTLRITIHILEVGDIVAAEVFAERLRQQHNAIGPAHSLPLNDGSFNDVSDIRQCDPLALKLLRNNGARCAGRFTDTERQITGGSSHRHTEVPAPGGPRVFHEALDYAHAYVTCCLI